VRSFDPLFDIGFDARCSFEAAIRVNQSIFRTTVLSDLGRVHAVAVAALPRARTIFAVLPVEDNTVAELVLF